MQQIQRLSGRGAQVHAIIEKDGKVVSESDGPNAVLETMSDNIKELEKKREDLKPEWLRTFGQLQKRARQA